MITLKKPSEIELMKKAGAITAGALEEMSKAVRPGISTLELDEIAKKYIKENKATASFYRYNGFPKSICASIDDEVIHGIPSENRILQDGQIISIDVGAIYNGWHGDAARTFAVGQISEKKARLIKTTEQSFWNAMKVIKEGAWLRDVGEAIQETCESCGYSVVRTFVGHGIGRKMHEDPQIPNYATVSKGIKLLSGMTLAIEPMVCEGGYEVDFGSDGWTVTTRDGGCAAHYENTVLVTMTGYEILTKTE